MTLLASLSPRSRVAIVKILPVVACILMFALGMRMEAGQERARQRASKVYQQKKDAAQVQLDAVRERLSAALQERKITSDQWLTAVGMQTKAYHEKFLAASKEWSSAGLPPSGQVSVSFLKNAPLALLTLHLLGLVLWYLLGRWLLDALRKRGYDWLDIRDAQWLVVVLPRSCWKIPAAHDFLTVPGNSPDLRHLVNFMRQQAHNVRAE